jgi:hypothetical protein
MTRRDQMQLARIRPTLGDEPPIKLASIRIWLRVYASTPWTNKSTPGSDVVGKHGRIVADARQERRLHL